MGTAARYDVFLSHAGVDKSAVLTVADHLRTREGLRPFLDVWNLTPGAPWQEELAEALAQSASAAVFIGPSGATPWLAEEMRVALDRAAREAEDFRVIPVLLPGADTASLDPFLAQRTWVDFRTGLDDEAALTRLAAGIRGEAWSDESFQLPDDPAPYRGLYRFERDDHWLFFGREADVARLLDKLRETRFAAVVGASGSGKSSLVRAGLVPRLGELEPAAGREWDVLVCRPGADPFRALATELARLGPPAEVLARADELAARFAERDDGLGTALDVLLDPDRPLLLVVDQFEELMVDPSRPGRGPGPARFVANLASATTGSDREVRVVVTLRADFVSTALGIPGLPDLLQDSQVLLGGLDGPRLRDAIVKPAEAVGAMFEKGLVSRIMADVDAEPGHLPLLQHALFELWTHRRGPWLTIDAYERSGGVVGALPARAEEVWAALPPAQQDVTRQVFVRLTTLGEGVPDTRRRVPRDQLFPTGADPATVDAALLAWSSERARLVVIDEGGVEVAHEALLHTWSRLRGWLADDRQALRVHRRLGQAAQEWAEELDEDPDALYAGGRLVEARELAATRGDELNALEQRFLDESIRHEADELADERERSRRLRQRLVVAAVALVLAVAGVIAAVIGLRAAARETVRAEREAANALRESERSRAVALAAQSELVQRENPALGLVLAAESAETTPDASPEAHRALVGGHVAHAAASAQQLGPELVGHGESVLGVAFSHDGSRVASGSIDRTVRLWDVATGEEVGEPFVGHDRGVNAVAFSPDDEVVASASDDGTVRLWDRATRQARRVLVVDGKVHGVAVSPDGTRVATASDDGLQLWDAQAGTALGPPRRAHGDWVLAVAFAPDGDTLATGGREGAVLLWDVDGSDPIARLERHDGSVTSVAFDRAGDRLASASRDGSVRLWDVATAEPRGAPLQGHRRPLAGVAFSPTEDVLASTGSDATVRLWNATTGRPLGEPLRGHTGVGSGVAFGPDGTTLASSSRDDTLRLWATDVRGQIGGTVGSVSADDGAVAITGVAVVTDGEAVVSGDDDGRLQRWDPVERAPLGDPVTAHPDGVTAVVADRDGTLLASAGRDGTVGLWRPADLSPTGAGRIDVGAHVHDVAADPAGDRVATATDDGVAVWDPATGDVVHDGGAGGLRGGGAPATAVALGPGGRLAAAGEDGAIRVWDGDGRPIGEPLVAHTRRINDLAFSSDGRMLASASLDGSVRRWDADAGVALDPPLSGHPRSVTSVTFSPDDSLLVSGGDDAAIRMWNADTGVRFPDALDHRDDVSTVVFADDSWVLYSGSANGRLRRWDVFDPARACSLAERFVRLAQVTPFLAGEQEPQACQLS